ncbi:MAG TPA: PQQ-binding-like beta-propeller repeat protein [Rhizomicrobium sp.]|jgi:outer membrane protein assembly factor BamB
MKISTFAAGVALASLLVTGAVFAQGANKSFSVDQSTIGQLLDDPQAHAIFAKHFPQIVNDPKLANAHEQTLAEIRVMTGGIITDAKLAAMDADLRALNPAAATVSAAAAPATNEWLTWGYDQERTGWNRAETTLGKNNVSKLRPIWTTQLSVPVDKYVLSTMTAPVIAAGVSTPAGTRDVMFILGANDTVFALDASTGAQLWQKSFANPLKAQKPRTWLCADAPNDTPTIDKARGIVFFITGDGKLRGLNLADGAERLTPVDMVAPFARAWSLNLIDNVIYSTSGRACGEISDKSSPLYAAAISGTRRRGTGPLLDASAVNAADVSDLEHPSVIHFYTSGARPAAPWGRGGAAKGPNGSVILETSDGLYDPAAGDFSESILKVAPKATRLMDSFTPTNWKDNLQHDMSGSATPVVFNFAGRTLIAASQKESVLRILDAGSLGGDNHMTPLWQSPKLGNDAKTGTDPSRGVWGAIATYETGRKRYLYLPLYGEPSKDSPAFPNTNGDTPNGRVMAFQVLNDAGKISAAPVWTSHDMVMPDPPVVANGVVYALSTGGQAMQNMAHVGEKRMPYDQSAVLRSTPVAPMILYAYDAETGKPLWNSKKMLPDWAHFSEPVVALGKVFVVTHDARVVALGLKK